MNHRRCWIRVWWRRHSSPSQQAARREQAVLLADALGRLPEDYREVIILRQMEGLEFRGGSRPHGQDGEECGEIVDASPSSPASCAGRGLMKETRRQAGW